jgi:Na+/proline symporter
MNKPAKIVLSGIMGTNVMTLFSYLISALAKENFSEPEHLSTMINRLAPGISKKWLKVAGWGAHYAVGILFAAVYAELWENGTIKPSVRNGLVIGALSGAIAVLIWKATFKAHPLPPWIDFKNYYLQLVPAHMVFAVFATITYRLTGLQEENESA